MSRAWLMMAVPATPILRPVYRPLGVRSICTSPAARVTTTRPCTAKTAPPGNEDPKPDEEDMSMPSPLAQSEMRRVAMRAMRKRPEPGNPKTKDEILSAPSKFKTKTPSPYPEDQPMTKWERKLAEAGMHPHDLSKSIDPTIGKDGSELGESEGFYSEEDRKIRAEWREYWRQQSVRYLRRLHRLEERRMADAMGFKSLEEAKAAGWKYSDRAMGRGEATLPNDQVPSRKQRLLHAGLIGFSIVSVVYLALFHNWGDKENIFSPLRRWLGFEANVRLPEPGRFAKETPTLEYREPLDPNMSLAEYYIHIVKNMSGGAQLKSPPTFEQQLENAGVVVAGTPYSPQEMEKVFARMDAKDKNGVASGDEPPNVYLLDEGVLTKEEEEEALQEVQREANKDRIKQERKSWWSN